MKRKNPEVSPSPKIPRLQQSEERPSSSTSSGPLSKVSSAWLDCTGDSSQGPESDISSASASPVLSGNSTESSQTDDPNTEPALSEDRGQASTEFFGAARMIAITDLPVAKSGKSVSLVGRNSPVAATFRHLSGGRPADNLHVTDASGDFSHSASIPRGSDLYRSSPSFESLLQAYEKSPSPAVSTEEVGKTVIDNQRIDPLRSIMPDRTQEPKASVSASRDSPSALDSIHYSHVLNGRSTDKYDQSRLSPVFRFGQSRLALGKHSHASSALKLTTAQGLQTAHTTLPVSPIPTYSLPQSINSIPRPHSHASYRSPVPHHSVYETSTGNLFRSIVSPAQTSASGSPASLRMPISRPDGVCLMPRRKSYSESTVSG